MAPPGTFERVYAALKQKLREGGLRPGARLEPAALSEDLNASVTPIRDALHRLTGERLVDAPRHEGFRVPMLTETGLRHLYAWHRDLLQLALMRGGSRLDRASGGAEDEPQGDLLLALAAATGNGEHLAAAQALADRLQPVRLIEAALLEAAEEESAAIIAALDAGDRRLLRKRLASYHRRRERIVPELIGRLQAG